MMLTQREGGPAFGDDLVPRAAHRIAVRDDNGVGRAEDRQQNPVIELHNSDTPSNRRVPLVSMAL